ncbi:MAG: SpaA isopeptide-forming pilin-related protein [Sharpea porci]|uniref:SpaA isopeptide-forming pilin-related protein n=1 Tax=Sharpea porci TaxID=2652286 RepID=UPI00240902E2|nr:SpaA isopeptide-forming pilin-related protein [Sharpea porci]MDD6711852.1 SpaA isopeptide-forming pilin-related protein [Sharpea porci]
MNRILGKRILSGIIAGLMMTSNINMPVHATGTDTTVQANSENAVTTETKTDDTTKKSEDTTTPTTDQQSTPTTTQTNPVVTGTFRVSGDIQFDEKLDDTDWSDLVRPAAFDQPIVVVQKYTDSNGQEQTITSNTQDDDSRSHYYLKFVHDGEGGGSFVIENIPKSYKDNNNVEHQFTYCTVDIVQPTLPYYKSKSPITVDMSNPATLSNGTGTLTLSLKSQNLTLKPTIVPTGGTDNPTFQFSSTFTNTNIKDENNPTQTITKTKNMTYTATSTTPKTVAVPLGIQYTLQQNSADGYRLDPTYTTTATTTKDDGTTETKPSTTSQQNASGTIADKTDITVTTTNYAQNVEVGFDVTWVDNNKATRPTIDGSNFALEYKTTDGDWTEVTSDTIKNLSLKSVPTLDTSRSSLNQYAYKGLPAIDINGKPLTYRVVVKKAPVGYGFSYNDHDDTKRREIVLNELTNYQATITWNDKDKSTDQSQRPTDISALGLKLYRKVDNGTYELVNDALSEDMVKKGDSSWTLNIADLPRYNNENKEYDYVLVQGTIANNTITKTPLSNYKTYYSNGSGNYGNDTTLCHNSGTITEVLYDSVNFTAKKIWKDTDATKRPTATVTLWRYVKSKADNIDDAYVKGLATKVIFQTTTDHTVSYNLDNTKDSIAFTSETVADMPSDYQLPKYDDQGQEYVYFVRESLSNDNYATKYSDGDKSYQYGAPINGTITDVRREKAAVAITKIWKNPSNMQQINGATVKVVIKASADGGKTYDELPVYSDKQNSYDLLDANAKGKAQTISGFASSISQGDVTYYVNTYNDEGQPYDMSTAHIAEFVSINGQDYVVKDVDGQKVLSIDNTNYLVNTAHTGDITLADGKTKEYRYTQTNTITAKRSYDVSKTWDQSITDDQLSHISQVNIKLERRSTKDKADGSLADYEVVMNGDADTWSINTQDSRTWKKTISGLPQYDNEGYEYYYKATEMSFVEDGKTKTPGDNHWGVDYYRNTSGTTIVNYKVSTDDPYFDVMKQWLDNGDSVQSDETRKNVSIRVYRRSQLKAALEEQKANTNSQYANLDDLGNITFLYRTLTSSNNNYSDRIYFRELQKAIDGQVWTSGKKDSLSNYIVLEYQVGDGSKDGAKAGKYTYDDLLNAIDNKTSLTGTVENNDRAYSTEIQVEDNAQVYMTNTRIGQTSIHVNKTWNDEKNAIGARPTSISFQIDQDGAAYTNISDDVTVTSDEASNYTASIDKTTGIVTITSVGDNNQTNWNISIKGLPMFSSTAVPHTYSLEEVQDASTNTDNTNYSYIRKKTSSSVNETGKTQSYSFQYNNTITGTTSHVAYKYWQDPDIDKDNRPDLYFNLYQYKKSDLIEAQKTNANASVKDLPSYTLYTKYKDQSWTADGSDSTEKNYNWKVTVNDLPLFDDDGNEYGYVFEEKMNNDGQTVQGKYVSQAKTKAVSSSQITDAYKDTYEVFTNTISDYITLKGKKTWTGLSGYHTSNNDLPDPTLTLYRTVDSSITDVQQLTDDQINADINDNKLTLVDTTHLTDSSSSTTSNDKTRYAFPDSSVSDDETKNGLIVMKDGKPMLPKFDANGKRYIYLVRETMNGDIQKKLYVSTNTNGTISNTFRSDINRRAITVTKNWDKRTKLLGNENQYPSVTYNLYRYEIGKEDSTKKQIATHTINANEFTGENGQASYTFSDLLIYSPSGKQYCYYITEKEINGYSISYNDEAGMSDTTLNNNNRSDVTSLPANWDTTNTPIDTTVSTTNSYSDPGSITISGSKIWNDYGNSEGLRPAGSNFNITLKRHTNNENNQSNKVNETEITLPVKDQKDDTIKTPYIVWNRGDTPSKSKSWSYTIYNLERYAGNGMPYIYTVSEPQVTGYQKAPDVSKEASSNAVSMDNMTNGFAGTYYVRKNWMDGNNKYNMRPSSITVQLQRSTDNTTWSNVPEDEVKAVTLNKDNVMPNTRNNSWQYTFKNLPVQDKKGNAYHYRCEETEIGGIPVQQKQQTDGTSKYTAGAYQRVYTTQNDQQTVIENTLDSTSLVVTKNWVGDQNDKYQTRPDNLTFKLQKRGVIARDETGASTSNTNQDSEDSKLSNWTDVTNADGSSYTFTIGKSDNWTKTLEDLPTVEVLTDKDGSTYRIYSLYFRAVEMHADTGYSLGGTTYQTAKGARNYIDTTDYSTSDTNKDHTYNSTLARNESTITNKLIVNDNPKDIHVNKVWRRVAGEEKDAVFELKYKTDSDQSFNSYKTPVTETLSSTQAGEASITGWTNLPRYDRAGNALTYDVVEHDVDGYKTEKTSTTDATSNTQTYTFTNIQLQNYTVKKIWQNTDYSEKTQDGFKATFKLQQKVGTNSWKDVSGVDTKTLTTTSINDSTQQATWNNLPMYTTDGQEITYRAVETKINDVNVTNDTNGSYKVAYTYNNQTDPTFQNTETTATNHIIYGFVNLSKKAAYLASNVTEDKSLANVSFNIYKEDGKTLYASNIKTDTNGNLINDNGKYGDEKKYLVAGTYVLKEAATGSDYSLWSEGITFKVGITGGTTDTGEHGTAWISTNSALVGGLQLQTTYLAADAKTHTFGNDGCGPHTNNSTAVNLESRGVLTFTKTGPNNEALNTYGDVASASQAYFGVYLDEACTKQVSGMKPGSNKTTMILTNKEMDGTTEIPTQPNNNNVSYLRSYPSNDYPYTLLSGTYYIKELRAPAGYKLDTVIRKAVVDHIDSTTMDKDLSDVYPNNKAKISLLSATTGSTDYKWNNTPNVVTLYKMDQFGRKVPLSSDGYLELKANNSTFPTGENVIRLYQNTTLPATKVDGTTPVTGITYDEKGYWTLTGMLDAGKSYTLSEPDTNVDVRYVVAKNIDFTMNVDGTISIRDTNDTVSKDNPLDTVGNDYQNYYHADAVNNTIVMRDVARYLKTVSLVKHDNSGKAIPNISFKIYKKDGQSELPVLDDKVYLTTDSNGQINLANTDESIINKITGKPLKYGLDLGDYYFKEVERGASDQYRLMNNLDFSITAKTPSQTSTGYDDYAQVTYTTTGRKDATSSGDTVTITNTKVTAVPKTLNLIKEDSKNADTKLSGAQFELSYTSITKDTTGSLNTDSKTCITGTNGQLYVMQNGSITSDQPDISRKGTYTLKETKAPEGYMTPNESERTVAIFTVNSENKITDIIYPHTNLASKQDNEITSDTNGENKTLNLVVKNEKTKVAIAKKDDLESNVKTKNQKSLNGQPLTGATLDIYEGTSTSDSTKKKATLANNQSEWNWTNATLAEGTLKENTIYTLHESVTPTGYLTANDIYFKLSGTTTVNNIVVSQLYVWTDSAKPTSTSGDKWSKTSNLNNNVLTMVDEVVIAPVNLQKVLANNATNATEWNAVAGVEFTVRDDDTTNTLGTVQTNARGYLEWKNIDQHGYNPKLIYDENGQLVTSGEPTSIILKQNTGGYTFTETSAPSNVYNDGQSYHVAITQQNYRDYKTDSGYNINKYVNIVNNTWTEKGTSTSFNSSTGKAVNLPYHSTITLHKIDGDEEGQGKGIANTEFTLYKDSVADANIYKNATNNTTGIFKTDSKGDLSIEVHDKGTYILKETKAATGYILNENSQTITLTDQQFNQSNPLSNVSNERQKGSITLTKTDAGTSEALNGVVYTLKRTDVPKDNNGNDLTNYLLKGSVDVTTGHSYEAQQSNGSWSIVDNNVNNTDGRIIISNLNWGKYTLTEKKELSGYKLDSTSVTYTIDGTHTNTDSIQDELNVSHSKTNAKNSVVLNKTSNTDESLHLKKKGLAGAVFEIHKVNSTEKVAFYSSNTATTTVTQATTDANGNVTIYGLPTYGLPTDPNSTTPKEYQLVEVTAPKGYKLQTNPVTFTINRNGNVQIKNGETYQNAPTNANDKQYINMQDEPIKIYLKKLGETGDTGLTGANFTLKDKDENKKLANGESSETLAVNSENGIMIPIERVIGGNTYVLEETAAPDGYEATAVVTFKVNTDGTISDVSSTGGYRGVNGDTSCASVDQDNTRLSIRDELIRATLTNEDAKETTKLLLPGMQFELTPTTKSSFTTSDNTYTFTTDSNGSFAIPDGLLKYGNRYLLRQVKVQTGYYLSKAAKTGAILTVDQAGKVTVDTTQTSTYPYSVTTNNDSGTAQLTVTNTKATSFTLTKSVDGNMADYNGQFKIKLTAYEPDGTTEIGVKEITLKNGETYSSITGLNNDDAFGTDAIPEGAKLEISEDNDLNYTAIVKENGQEVGTRSDKGKVTVTLGEATEITLQLVNSKNMAIDVGVHTDNATPLAAVAVLIPGVWLAYRWRRRRKEGMYKGARRNKK